MPPPSEVWIFNHYADAPDRPAGTRHFDLGRGLVRRGFRVTIFAAGFSHATLRETRVPKRRLFWVATYDGVRFVWLRTLPYRGNTWLRLANMLSYAAMALLVQRRLRRPDAVIGSTIHPFAAAAGYIVARLRGAQFLFEIRDLWPQTLIDMGALREASLTARWMRWLEAILVKRAEVVITLLPETAQYLAQRGLPADHVLYLPNGVRLDVHRPGKAPARMAELIDRLKADGRFVYGYLGAHGRANHLDVVLDAAAQLSLQAATAIHVLLIGDGPEKPRLIRRASALGLKNVTFADPIPKNAVPGTLRRLDGAIIHLADIDVFRFGISPNKLFDYLANEVPVLSACRSPNDPVADAGAGMSLPPDDASALATAMRSMAALPTAERRRMGVMGRRYVERHHDIDLLAGELADRLSSLHARDERSRE